MEGFSLSVRSPSDRVLLEGPIPLSLMITYQGKGEIEILSDQFIDIEFEPPPGWTLKEKPKLRFLEGRLPTVTLAQGQSLSQQLYLHDYFSSITPGPTQLRITVTLHLHTEATSEPVVLQDVCAFEVMPPDPEGFQHRIEEIHRQILSEQSAEKRLELYKSLASLSHPDLIAIFLEALLDPAMLVFHRTARGRLVELAERYGQRDRIIKYLASHGSRYDGEFFRLWQQKQIRLSDEEILRLCESSSLWTRLFCLEHFEHQYNRKGLIESLKAELQELSERVRNLESAS
jgi:hypothetical protein